MPSSVSGKITLNYQKQISILSNKNLNQFLIIPELSEYKQTHKKQTIAPA